LALALALLADVREEHVVGHAEQEPPHAGLAAEALGGLQAAQEGLTDEIGHVGLVADLVAEEPGDLADPPANQLVAGLTVTALPALEQLAVGVAHRTRIHRGRWPASRLAESPASAVSCRHAARAGGTPAARKNEAR